MIRGFACQDGRLKGVDEVMAQLDRVTWMDLLDPTKEEEGALERYLGIDIPTREEREEIEISSRLYHQDGAAFMTATLPAQTEGEAPLIAPVTFVLAGKRLITIRQHEPRAFQTFPARAEKVSMACSDGETILIALLEAIVDRLADVLEHVGRDIDRISHEVFQLHQAKPTKSRDFQKLLEGIGRKGDLTSDIRDSLATLERLIGFLAHVTTQRKSNKDIRERVKTIARDVRSLADHASFLSQKNTFLLDATLGMINIEQNAIIKIFSVAAVVFLPPTLVASIYGMNFEVMPELHWLIGYPFAICLMIVSAILPFLYFKRRGWL
jgi:magnesium transporter